MSDQRHDAGMNVRRAVLGEEHVDRVAASTTEFTRDFQKYITESVWGEIWTRPGLDRKTRSLLTIAITAALGRREELELHVRATRNTGVSRDDVKEVLMHVGAYAGIPAANTGFAIAAAVYRQMDEEKNQ